MSSIYIFKYSLNYNYKCNRDDHGRYVHRGKMLFNFVFKQTDKVKVYKKAFFSLHEVTKARVRRLYDLLNDGVRSEGSR